MEESRMDRIEREMAEFLHGMRELREFQKETGIQIRELREAQKKTDEQIARTDEQIAGIGEQIAGIGEQLAKTIIKLDNVGASLGEMGLVQGKVAEDLFYRNVKSLFRQRDMVFADVRRNVKKKGVAEYDIVAADGDRVLVVEVKNRLERDMVDDFLNRKIPKFMQVFPQYRNRRLTGGVAALVMQDDVGRYAEKRGLYVMTQNGEGGAMLINRRNFRAKEFA
jgi:Holliday junction resolvase-like predicted endonuclease